MRHKKPLEPEDLGVEDSKMPVIKYDNIIDEEMVTQIDQGLCLSMHQPYASLLVAGVKKYVTKCCMIMLYLTNNPVDMKVVFGLQLIEGVCG